VGYSALALTDEAVCDARLRVKILLVSFGELGARLSSCLITTVTSRPPVCLMN
jgi:hypothetical protein